MGAWNHQWPIEAFGAHNITTNDHLWVHFGVIWEHLEVPETFIPPKPACCYNISIYYVFMTLCPYVKPQNSFKNCVFLWTVRGCPPKHVFDQILYNFEPKRDQNGSQRAPQSSAIRYENCTLGPQYASKTPPWIQRAAFGAL